MSYSFNTIVNRTEVDALKEMIFNRVRERNEGMSSSVQNDVMDLARNSFVSNDNPFSKIVAPEPQPTQTEPAAQTPNTTNVAPLEDETQPVDTNVEGLGFAMPTRSTQMSGQTRSIQEQTAGAIVAETMYEARAGLSNRQGFMGALNFLNSQAAQSLMRTRADKFEVIV